LNGADILFFDVNIDWGQSLGIIAARRGEDDHETVGMGWTDTEIGIGGDDEWPDVERSAVSCRDPVPLDLKQLFQSVEAEGFVDRRDDHAGI
jgi:hypothetical protein